MGISVASSLPAGCVAQFGGYSPPAGWLLCAGQAISRADYATLFNAIGTNFGAGDGSTTFNVPDMRGRVGIGRDDMGGTAANRITAGNTGINANVLGYAGGSEVVTLTASQIPPHVHQQKDKQASASVVNGAGGSISSQIVGYAGQSASGDSNPQPLNTISSGGGGAHAVIQPCLIINWIIKT